VNVVLLVSDTLRRDHVGAYGEGRARTPCLDRFAESAVRFDQAFLASFPTVPCRNDLLTGRYTFTYKPWEPVGADELLLPEILRRHGVLTYLIADTPHPFAPTYGYQRGFHGWELIRGQENDRWRVTPREVRLPCAPDKLRSPQDTVVQYLRNVATRRHEEDWFPARTALAAVRWLEEAVASGYGDEAHPFFLYLDFFDPHEPWDPPAHYLALYERGYAGESVVYPRYDRVDFLSPEELAHCRALYAGEVSLVDRWIGEVLAALDRLDLTGSTAVLVMADHGFYLGEHGYIGKSLITAEYQQPLPLYPEVCRIPFLLRVPGVPPGSAQALVQPVDAFATVLDLFGVDLREAPRAQGRSVLPALERRQDRAVLRPAAIAAPVLSHPRLRVPHPTSRASITDGDWLLVYGSQVHDLGDPETTAMVDSVLRSVRTLERGPIRPELYDLRQDPGARHDLWGAAGSASVATRLHEAFVSHLEASRVPEEHLRFFRRLP
jgi:arylsulfatase A-like enzyme